MPYSSKAQQGFFHAAESRGEMPHSTVHEFDEATKHKKGGFASLPNHVAKRARGHAMAKHVKSFPIEGHER